MKTPNEWMDACNQAFVFTEGMIEAIQCDAREDLELEVRRFNHNIEVYKERWHEARCHLRAANKGAERNAKALEMSVMRYHSLMGDNRRIKERDINNHKTIVWNWLYLSDEELSAKLGYEVQINPEQSALIRKLLKSMLGSSFILKHKL